MIICIISIDYNARVRQNKRVGRTGPRLPYSVQYAIGPSLMYTLMFGLLLPARSLFAGSNSLLFALFIDMSYVTPTANKAQHLKGLWNLCSSLSIFIWSLSSYFIRSKTR